MPEGTAPAAAPSATPAAPPVQSHAEQKSTVDSRAAAIMERLSKEGDAPEPADDADASTAPPVAPGASSSAASEAPTDTSDQSAAQRRADRLARINRVRAEESAKAEKRRLSQERNAEKSEVEKLRARISELEPMNSVFKDEETLLAAAEQRGMSAEKLVAWMRQRLTDPKAVAERQSKTIEESLRAEINQLKAKVEETEAQRKQREAEHAVANERVEAARTFIGNVAAKAGDAPLTAALLDRYKPEVFLGFVNHVVVPMLPEGYTLEELHDHVEQFLEEVQIATSGKSRPEETPGPTSQKNGAGQPPTTLSNAIASERAQVTEEIPLHKLPREERFARVKEKYSRE